jgi:hypothetical protein
MSLIIIFISRSREIKTVMFAAVIVAIFIVIVKSMGVIIGAGINFFQLTRDFQVYWLLDIILSVVFLLGFAVLGAWLLNRRHRLKMQKVERSVQ